MSECSLLVYLEMDVTPFSRLSPIIGHARAQLQTTFNVLTRATRLMFCTNHPSWTTTSLVILKTPCAGLSCFVTIYRGRLVRYKQTTSMLMPKCRFLMTPMLAHSLVMLFHPCTYTCMTSIHGVMLLTYPTIWLHIQGPRWPMFILTVTLPFIKIEIQRFVNVYQL